MYLIDRPVRLFRGLFHMYNDLEVRNDLQAYDEPNVRSLIIASSATDSSPARTG